jgi:hypothetical protein
METNARTVTSDNILMEQKQNDQTPKKKNLSFTQVFLPLYNKKGSPSQP